MIQNFLSRCLCTLFAAILSLGVLPAGSASEAPIGAGYVSTAGGNLNVRSGPGTGYSVVSSVENGTALTVYGNENGFFKVGYAKNKIGFVSSAYFKEYSGAYPAQVNISSGYLYIRSGPGTQHTAIGALYKGNMIIVISESSGWAKILYNNNQTGFVSSAYIKKLNEEKSVVLSVPDFKQTDSRWANTQLGTSKKTISQIGCTTTCLSMCESYRLGYSVYPDVMSKSLTYSPDGSLYWPSNYVTSVSVSDLLSTLRNLINKNKPVILGCSSSKGTHWVTVTGYKDGGLKYSDFYINDPGSSSRTLLSQFTAVYTDFYKIAYYN
ncbi:MAG: SH3 domain-containing protein [Oscillospiraceae bacterium]|nr:SH3 domain-containing protein [Oscillospiraceae bacterium]